MIPVLGPVHRDFSTVKTKLVIYPLYLDMPLFTILYSKDRCTFQMLKASNVILVTLTS